MSRVLVTKELAHVGCIHIGENGIVGYHQATCSQVFLVVAGEGWVRGKEDQRYRVESGDAVFWTEGEWHESGSETGMTVMVIESQTLNPADFMPVKSKINR